MIRKGFFLILMAVLYVGSSVGQQVDFIYKTLKDFSSELTYGNSRAVQYTVAESSSITEGSEYLVDSFENGEILTSEFEQFTGIPMRYNAFKDEIEVKLEDGKLYSLTDPTKIVQILLNSRKMIYTDFNAAGGKKSGYLFELYQGNSTLYCRNVKIFKDRIPSNGITPETPAKIMDKPREYYIRIKDELPRIFSSKKDLLEILKSHLSEMEEYLKKGKLKYNNEEDMVRVLTYYDSL
jgi:hypothetical protein